MTKSRFMCACPNVSNRFVYHSNFLTLIVTTMRIHSLTASGPAAVPSIMESIPSLRHKYIVPSGSSESIIFSTTPVIQRGDQQPVDVDDEQLFSGEVLSGEEDESREAPYRKGDYFQRPGMINNHINYNKYNSIFTSGASSMRHQRQNGGYWQNFGSMAAARSYQRGGRLFELFVTNREEVTDLE